MARDLMWSETKFKRFISEGRGQGKREKYRPWLTVSDIPSRGRSTRLYSHKANRIVHLLTDAQLRYFYLLEWSASTTDINEQYPLLNMETIIDQLDGSLIKRLKGRDNLPHVMLTTFLITAMDGQGKEYQSARTIKDAVELEKAQTIERLELQRRYFNSRNIDFGIVTPYEIPMQRSKNIEWVLSALNVTNYGVTQSEMIRYSERLLDRLSSKNKSLNDILTAFDRHMNVEVGTGLFVLRYLIASRRIQINMDLEIKLDRNPSDIGIVIVENAGGSSKYVVGD